MTQHQRDGAGEGEASVGLTGRRAAPPCCGRRSRPAQPRHDAGRTGAPSVASPCQNVARLRAERHAHADLRERCETANESRPWMPTAASMNAMAANAPSTRTCTDRDAVSRSTMSVASALRRSAVRGSARRMISRTDGTSVAGVAARPDHQLPRHVEQPAPSATCCDDRYTCGSLSRSSPRNAHVADNADDVALAEREGEMAADRILVGPVASDERLAHDGDELAVARIGVADVASAHGSECPASAKKPGVT